MSVSVSMPQLGESVTEGTVTRWLKREGEHVEADEPLLEVSTDKVDTEIPSPVSGVLRGITVAEDETVAVGAELAVIDEDGAAQPARSTPRPSPPPSQRQRPSPPPGACAARPASGRGAASRRACATAAGTPGTSAAATGARARLPAGRRRPPPPPPGRLPAGGQPGSCHQPASHSRRHPAGASSVGATTVVATTGASARLRAAIRPAGRERLSLVRRWR